VRLVPSHASVSRRPLALLLGLVLASALAGCGGGFDAGDKGYVDGRGVITRLAPEQREAPGELEGESLDGEPLSLAALEGDVVVVNVWGAWCPPCRKEAPLLAEVARELEGDGVRFLGINARDNSQDQALAFERRYDIPYDSLWDPAGRALLAFSGTLPPNSIPSTVILDAEGRVAASIVGEVTSASTLVGLIEDVRDGADEGTA
jgi:thiol-disulfide isomerase/thioredoxin